MTKAQIKFIQSLSRQKYRKEHNAYIIEGDKNAKEWLRSNTHIQQLVATKDWLLANEKSFAHLPAESIYEVADYELEKMTSLQTAQQVLLVAEIPQVAEADLSSQNWSLYLEKIQDPGNMGTIIRTADWFGIGQIICSPDCVDVYNPKVVQATMGSLNRISIAELSTEALIGHRPKNLYAASLQGENIRTLSDKNPGIIAMGNESQGLSAILCEKASHKIMIPRLGNAESLNVSVATGIICAELMLRG